LASQGGWSDNAEDPRYAARLAVDKYGRSLGLSLKEQVEENRLQTPLTVSKHGTRRDLLRVSPDEIQARMYPVLRAAEFKRVPEVSTIVDERILAAACG
jgi:hypothetical protein